MLSQAAMSLNNQPPPQFPPPHDSASFGNIPPQPRGPHHSQQTSLMPTPDSLSDGAAYARALMATLSQNQQHQQQATSIQTNYETILANIMQQQSLNGPMGMGIPRPQQQQQQQQSTQAPFPPSFFSQPPPPPMPTSVQHLHNNNQVQPATPPFTNTISTTISTNKQPNMFIPPPPPPPSAAQTASTVTTPQQQPGPQMKFNSNAFSKQAASTPIIQQSQSQTGGKPSLFDFSPNNTNTNNNKPISQPIQPQQQPVINPGPMTGTSGFVFGAAVPSSNIFKPPVTTTTNTVTPTITSSSSSSSPATKPAQVLRFKTLV
jgi:hypothetical protein